MQQYYNFEPTLIHWRCFEERYFCDGYLSLLYFFHWVLNLCFSIPIQFNSTASFKSNNFKSNIVIYWREYLYYLHRISFLAVFLDMFPYSLFCLEGFSYLYNLDVKAKIFSIEPEKHKLIFIE